MPYKPVFLMIGLALCGASVAQPSLSTRKTLGPNIILNGDFSRGMVHFVSPVIAYIEPRVNALWGPYYTIMPRFNNPQLHEYIPALPYAAPIQKTRREQVFYANCSWEEEVVVLTTKVKCLPNTRYRLSLQAISLTPGADCIPSFEFLVDGNRSEPRPAGEGKYLEVSREWKSGPQGEATVQIIRNKMKVTGRLFGIANIEMVPIRDDS